MGVKVNGFEEAIMELMSATEVNLKDASEGISPRKIKGNTEVRGYRELKNLISNINYKCGVFQQKDN